MAATPTPGPAGMQLSDDHKQVLEEMFVKVKTSEDAKNVYNWWADSYESGFVTQCKYEQPASVSTVFRKYVLDRAAPVLDAGCGTGLVGVELCSKTDPPYTCVDGLDICAPMLDKARAKGVYRSLIEADMTKRLPIEDGVYGAVICVGTFTLGHVPPSGLDELIRVVRKGGVVTFGCNTKAYDNMDMGAKLRQVEADGVVRIEAATTEPNIEGTPAHVVVLRVL